MELVLFWDKGTPHGEVLWDWTRWSPEVFLPNPMILWFFVRSQTPPYKARCMFLAWAHTERKIRGQKGEGLFTSLSVGPSFLSRLGVDKWNQRPGFGGGLGQQTNSTFNNHRHYYSGTLSIPSTAESHTVLAPQHLPVPPHAHGMAIIKEIGQEKQHLWVQHAGRSFCIQATRVARTPRCWSSLPRLHSKGYMPSWSHFCWQQTGLGRCALSTMWDSYFILHSIQNSTLLAHFCLAKSR